MLVLSRRPGERILIGPNIVIEVLDVRGDKVRLGIAAPADVIVNREEVALRILPKDEGRDSADGK